MERFVWCFRTKPVLDASTNPNAVGVQKACVRLRLAIIYASIAMFMVRSNHWQARSFFLIMPFRNTDCMNIFFKELSSTYPNDKIILVCDGAAWHKAKRLEIPTNIRLLFIPPYTPEMNPIEQIWKEIRKLGFKNEIFASLEKVVDRLCETISNLPKQTISSITGRQWILSLF